MFPFPIPHPLVISALALLPFAATLAQEPPADVPVPPPIAGRGYRLVKDWDFSKNVTTKEKLYEEFHTRYIYNHGRQDTLNDEWQRFRDNDNHVFADGSLKLTARIVGGLKRFGIESGMLRSKWTGQYGYFECRLKVPGARGMWPAFWINPEDGRWPPEIDVVEIVNNGRDGPHNSFHFVHNKGKPAVDIETKLDQWQAYRPGFDFSADYHTFAVEWTPDTVTHYVDGVPVAKRQFHWTHDDGSDGAPPTYS